MCCFMLLSFEQSNIFELHHVVAYISSLLPFTVLTECTTPQLPILFTDEYFCCF